MCMEFQFRKLKIKKVLERDGGDGCTTNVKCP